MAPPRTSCGGPPPWLAGIAGVGSVSTVAVYAAQQPDRAAAITLMDKLSGDPAMGVLTAVFVLGHLIGMLLLGIALYRSRAVPRWAAVLVGISPVLHAAGMALSAAADAGTFYLMTIGMLGCAWALLRVPDEEWDLGPAGPDGQPQWPGPATPGWVVNARSVASFPDLAAHNWMI